MSTEGGLQREFFDMLMDSQWWSADALRNYQRSQLSPLLRHAKKNVPFYEHRLDAVVKPNGDIDWDRWSEVPIVKRQDIVERGDKMLAREIPTGHGGKTASTTSGTSGAPITLTSTQLAQQITGANRYRSYRWHGIDWTKDSCSVFGNDPDVAAWPDGQLIGPWGPIWDPLRIDGMLIRLNRRTPSDQILEFLRRKRPSYLTTGPNTAIALAMTAKNSDTGISLDAFLPHGAAPDQSGRDLLSAVFGARTVDLYSSKEAGPIAHACPSGNGLIVNAESLLVEIVDEQGLPVPPGVSGRIIITTIFNTAQPLLRYDQGDLARWAPTCNCGRHMPHIEGLVGRSTTLFYHPDGRVRSAFLGSFRHLLKCQSWQIAQIAPTRFEIRYVPIDPLEVGDEGKLAEHLRDLYFEDAQVQFVRVSSIPVGETGKAREYVNEWMPLQ